MGHANSGLYVLDLSRLAHLWLRVADPPAWLLVHIRVVNVDGSMDHARGKDDGSVRRQAGSANAYVIASPLWKTERKGATTWKHRRRRSSVSIAASP